MADFTRQTYLCAKASGDLTYLYWLRDRLEFVYKEDSYTDFVQTLGSFQGYFIRRLNAPWWLNWILRKYDL